MMHPHTTLASPALVLPVLFVCAQDAIVYLSRRFRWLSTFLITCNVGSCLYYGGIIKLQLKLKLKLKLIPPKL